MKRLLMMALVLLVLTSVAEAVEFAADVVESRDVVTLKGRLWFKNGTYRLQMKPTGGPDQYFIVNRKADKTQVVYPKYNAYVEVSADDFMLLMANPFEAAAQSAKMYQAKEDGQEKLNGQKCERRLFQMQGQDVMRQWTSTELNFPIKIEVLLKEDWYTELKNIRRSKVNDDDLMVPPTYARKSIEEIMKLVEADPEAIARAEAYRKNRPRKTEKRQFLGAGETWNLVLRPGLKIRIEADQFGSQKSFSWFAVPYKGQKAIKPKDQCTYQGKAKVKLDRASRVDGIAMGVLKGKGSFKVALIGRLPHVQAMQSIRFQKAIGGSSWQVDNSYKSYRIAFKCIEGNAAGVRLNTAEQKTKFKLTAGQSRQFDYTPQDQLLNVDFNVDYGEVEVLCIQDNRDRAKPHILISSASAAETGAPNDAELYAACREDKRAPWCYEKKVVEMRVPDMCANITRHWGSNARGVEGYCFYEIAKKTKDCSLCKKIKDRKLRNNLCNRDVCHK